jgi:hypothetical protein
MLAKDRDGAAQAADDLQRMTEVVGLKTAAAKARLAEIETMFAAVGKAPTSDVHRLGDAVAAGLHTGSASRTKNAKKTVA